MPSATIRLSVTDYERKSFYKIFLRWQELGLRCDQAQCCRPQSGQRMDCRLLANKAPERDAPKAARP